MARRGLSILVEIEREWCDPGPIYVPSANLKGRRVGCRRSRMIDDFRVVGDEVRTVDTHLNQTGVVGSRAHIRTYNTIQKAKHRMWKEPRNWRFRMGCCDMRSTSTRLNGTGMAEFTAYTRTYSTPHGMNGQVWRGSRDWRFSSDRWRGEVYEYLVKSSKNGGISDAYAYL